MKKIEAQIQWYQQNANSRYDEMIAIELEKIDRLYSRYENHADELFVEEMIDSFCKIMCHHREKIRNLENNGTNPLVVSPEEARRRLEAFDFTDHYVSATPSAGGFTTDKQLQEAFTAYCLNKGKSTYTVNDYCSRIRNLWKSFYGDNCRGELPEEMTIGEDEVEDNSPLLNAYRHVDLLQCYVSMMTAVSEGNRNWANVRAAFNKWDEFRTDMERNK